MQRRFRILRGGWGVRQGIGVTVRTLRFEMPTETSHRTNPNRTSPHPDSLWSCAQGRTRRGVRAREARPRPLQIRQTPSHPRRSQQSVPAWTSPLVHVRRVDNHGLFRVEAYSLERSNLSNFHSKFVNGSFFRVSFFFLWCPHFLRKRP